jgi:hypothetical protein
MIPVENSGWEVFSKSGLVKNMHWIIGINTLKYWVKFSDAVFVGQGVHRNRQGNFVKEKLKNPTLFVKNPTFKHFQKRRHFIQSVKKN